ncbi:hypothetical protein D9613_009286 [Agrocybe pediades]|uniref:Uncharacterized protein n=1 Tax=Agrocybe pediades TaxID=84607 RepID=A0A8H4VU75_9AGAR|nr:hypothetical protein D9613_009286 [Agrocybe pediades]
MSPDISLPSDGDLSPNMVGDPHNTDSTGFALGALYVASTLLSGFPTWVKLRKNIQAARIDSVMKIQ